MTESAETISSSTCGSCHFGCSTGSSAPRRFVGAGLGRLSLRERQLESHPPPARLLAAEPARTGSGLAPERCARPPGADGDGREAAAARGAAGEAARSFSATRPFSATRRSLVGATFRLLDVPGLAAFRRRRALRPSPLQFPGLVAPSPADSPPWAHSRPDRQQPSARPARRCIGSPGTRPPPLPPEQDVARTASPIRVLTIEMLLRRTRLSKWCTRARQAELPANPHGFAPVERPADGRVSCPGDRCPVVAAARFMRAARSSPGHGGVPSSRR